MAERLTITITRMDNIKWMKRYCLIQLTPVVVVTRTGRGMY